MKLLEQITLDTIPPRHIELLQGDLTEIPDEFAVDLLVVSAFPGRYNPSPGTLVKALHDKGVSVAALAADRAIDLGASFGCWLSHPMPAAQEGMNFNRLMCFEPSRDKGAPEQVQKIFRALIPILGANDDISSVALPLVATGNQRAPVKDIIEPLLEGAVEWLNHGLPLSVIRIVTYSDEDTEIARATFRDLSDSFAKADSLLDQYLDLQRGGGGEFEHLLNVREKTPLDTLAHETLARKKGITDPAKPDRMKFDVFISYAHEDLDAAREIETKLKELWPEIRIFRDEHSIDIGRAWQPTIFENLDYCHKIMVLFSPDYLQSDVCKEEYNISWMRARNEGANLLFPLFVYDADLPTYMEYQKYLDCREGDSTKLADATAKLVEMLRA